jgi:hypothetical protein
LAVARPKFAAHSTAQQGAHSSVWSPGDHFAHNNPPLPIVMFNGHVLHACQIYAIPAVSVPLMATWASRLSGLTCHRLALRRSLQPHLPCAHPTSGHASGAASTVNPAADYPKTHCYPQTTDSPEQHMLRNNYCSLLHTLTAPAPCPHSSGTCHISHPRSLRVALAHSFPANCASNPRPTCQHRQAALYAASPVMALWAAVTGRPWKDPNSCNRRPHDFRTN